MKKILLTCMFFTSILITAQTTFGEQNIIAETETDGANSVYAIDIDGDGDLDVLSSSRGDSKVAWYENTDGNGTFGSQQIITTNAVGVQTVYAADIDGDGDMDVLSASNYDDKIAWYENTDGNGTFGSQQIITTSADGAISVYAIDIDGDNDMDVLSDSIFDDKIAWYENTDGNGTFGSQQIISTGGDDPNSVHAIDIDGDGDMDVLSASTNDNKIAWYENIDGNGTFGSQQVITTDAEYAESVYGADIDGDGDIDVLSASFADNKIAWYENTDGNGTFGSQQIITTSAGYAISVYAADIDGDGDMDVLSASHGDDEITWYENIDGNGAFGSQQVINTSVDGAISVYAADIDGDGDMDVLSASLFDNKIAWYENLGALKNEIIGTLRLNLNSDGCNGNNILPNILVNTTDGAESFSIFTLANGIYQLFPEIGNFTTTVILQEPYANYYTTSPNNYTTNFSDVGNSFTANFCLEPTSVVNDLNISVLPLNVARPGFDTTYQIVYKNVGTTQLSGSVVFEFDQTKLSFLNASETVSTQTINSLTFDYTDLNPFETRTINIVLNVLAPPTVQNNDLLVYVATINPIAADETVVDNVYNFNQTVVGSFDPNDITCIEGEEILLADADNYLHYIIRFQNTGNYYATFVRINNILDNNLDWNSLQILSASHNLITEIKNGNEVNFKFDAIYLPDSTTDEPNSHGFITYKIKPKAAIGLGDIISNKADIFFDYNTAIETNIATTTIVNTLSVKHNTLLNFSVYPIPAENVLTINSKKEIIKIEIYSKLGQLILKNTTENTIDISNLTQGLYFVKVEDVNGNFGVKKIVKK